jgi:hypothetical protein
MAVSFPLINAHRYSWASVAADVNGAELVQFKEINYSHKLEPGKVRGIGPQIAGATRGEYEAEGSMVLYQEEWDVLRDRLGDGYMEVYFPISVSYAEDGQPTTTDELVGCRITSVEKKPSQGTDGLEVSCNLHITYLLENGKKPLKNMRL